MAPSMTPTARQVPTLEGQAAPIEALPALLEAFPGLPAPYITIHRLGAELGLGFPSPSAFEEWRVALGIPASAVELEHGPGQSWLTAKGTFSGASIDLTGHGIVGGAR